MNLLEVGIPTVPLRGMVVYPNIVIHLDIGRDKYAFYSRSVEKYLDYFRFWARIQNQIVVYTTPELAPKVMEIRGEFGLADKTVVIEVADVFGTSRTTKTTANHNNFHILIVPYENIYVNHNYIFNFYVL